jgi:prophage regulatory protein
MAHRILRLPEVITKTGLGRTKLWKMTKEKQFPESVSLGAQSMGWIEAEIDGWIEQRMAERQTRTGGASPSR